MKELYESINEGDLVSFLSDKFKTGLVLKKIYTLFPGGGDLLGDDQFNKVYMLMLLTSPAPSIIELVHLNEIKKIQDT